MSKQVSTKPKPVPWIPAGTNVRRDKKPAKQPTTKYKIDAPGSPKTIPKKIVDVPKIAETTFRIEDIPKEKEPKDVEPDVMSLSSHSSYGGQTEPDIHLISIFQEMKLFYIHFSSLKASYLSANRIINPTEIEDGNINELLIEAGACINELNTGFDDLEYSVSVYENTLDEKQKMQEFSNAIENKQKLLSKLFDMYEKVINIFVAVFEKQDLKKMSELQDSLNRKCQITEKRNISLEAVVKDLERRLSIYQSKANALESYKTNLECAKVELEKQLQHKESHIKYLNSELLDASRNPTKSDHEEYIEIIERIKSNAHAEKSELKKALKFKNVQSRKDKEEYQKLIQNLKEKEKMMFDIAAQRDQLKIQLTVVSNNTIEQRNQMEQLKIQNAKLQNEITEKEVSDKKAVADLQNSLDEKSSEVEKLLKTKSKLEKTIEELEAEIQTSKGHLKMVKDDEVDGAFLNKSNHTQDMQEEIHRLISLLQNARDVFENLRQSSHITSGVGDHAANNAEFSSVQNQILAAVGETKEHLLELKNMYKASLQEQKGVPEHKDRPRNNDLEKQLKKMEQFYNAARMENMELKQDIEELKNSRVASPAVQKNDNYLTTNMPSDNFTKKIQFELIKKNDDIAKMKYDFKMKENYFQDQLKEYKEKLRTLEIDSMKLSSVEEELKSMKIEFSLLQKRKEEEAERLLQRTTDLQTSLDRKTKECEGLKQHVNLLKSSYFNVFGDS